MFPLSAPSLPEVELENRPTIAAVERAVGHTETVTPSRGEHVFVSLPFHISATVSDHAVAGARAETGSAESPTSTWDGTMRPRADSKLSFPAPDAGAVAGLVAERNSLAHKLLSGCLVEREQRRLDLVRWYLDRLEEAQLGPALDDLERVVEAQERTAAMVEGFLSQLQSQQPATGHLRRSSSRL
jgi:hypothetical protein